MKNNVLYKTYNYLLGKPKHYKCMKIRDIKEGVKNK